MKFGVLGPLTVTTGDGKPVELKGSRLRALLSTLLFHANHTVPVDRLVEALWADSPPKSYLSNLHTYVSRLRDRLDGVSIEHDGGSYQLTVPEDAVDLHVMRSESAAGRRAAGDGDPARAVRHFRRALALWRDRALVDVPVPLLDSEVLRLESERLNLVEACLDAELAAGAGAGLVSEIEELVTQHPLREGLSRQLMAALARAGRRADALEVYRRTRTALINTLGIEPGPELRQLHAAILRGDALSPTPVVRAAPSGSPIRQLPPPVADFCGRQEVARELCGLLMTATTGVPVVVICGQPGVGKSALAVRVAHDVQATFPDGQLFAHLAGASPTPKGAADVLGDLLRSLGLPGSQIPDDLEARAAAFRARLADRRMLVVLDDVAEPAQVRPLLPGSAGCAVLVTSRSRLSGLSATHVLSLDPLGDADAVSLLGRVAGPDRVAREKDAAARIVAACGRLPLALRIAGARLAARPHLSLNSLAGRLNDERSRLDELSVSDLQVRASVAPSFDGQTPLANCALRLLGLLGLVDVAGWVVAALLDVPDAESAIQELVEASLLEETVPDSTGEPRYWLHDLLRIYAQDRARATMSREEQLAGVRRAMVTTLALADRAARRSPRVLHLVRLADAVEPALPLQNVVDRVLVNPAAWFASERLNLIAAVRFMCDVGWLAEAALLAERLTGYLWQHAFWADLREVHQSVRDAAARAGDELTKARSDHLLALVLSATGRRDEAAAVNDQCRATFERLGDQHGLACVLSEQANLKLLAQPSKAEESMALAQRAAELFRAENDHFGEVYAQRAITMALSRFGKKNQAAQVGLEALARAKTLEEPMLARCTQKPKV